MKKLAIIAALVILTGCKTKTEAVSLQTIDSDIYSMQEISEAADTIYAYFNDNFEGCTLQSVAYEYDDPELFAEYAEQYEADEAIVLSSTFTTDENGGDGSLNPNDTYTDYHWILVRDEGGSWRHADHGYA